MGFVIHWHESAMELHVFPIPIPPPTSLSTWFLWVFPVHQARALSWDPMDCSLPGSSVHAILQATIFEWVAISFSIQGGSCFKYTKVTQTNDWTNSFKSHRWITKEKDKSMRKSDLLVEHFLYLVRENNYITYLWLNVYLIWQTISLKTLSCCSLTSLFQRL